MATVYVVLRSDWYYNDEYTAYREGTVKAFADRAVAEAFLERCNARAEVEARQHGDTIRHVMVETQIPAAGA